MSTIVNRRINHAFLVSQVCVSLLSFWTKTNHSHKLGRGTHRRNPQTRIRIRRWTLLARQILGRPPFPENLISSKHPVAALCLGPSHDKILNPLQIPGADDKTEEATHLRGPRHPVRDRGRPCTGRRPRAAPPPRRLPPRPQSPASGPRPPAQPSPPAVTRIRKPEIVVCVGQPVCSFNFAAQPFTRQTSAQTNARRAKVRISMVWKCRCQDAPQRPTPSSVAKVSGLQPLAAAVHNEPLHNTGHSFVSGGVGITEEAPTLILCHRCSLKFTHLPVTFRLRGSEAGGGLVTWTNPWFVEGGVRYPTFSGRSAAFFQKCAQG